MRRLALALSLGVALGACSLVVDTSELDEGSTTGGDGGAGGTSSSSGGPSGRADAGPLPGTVEAEPPVACPAVGRACVADAPSGWTGPLVVFDGPNNPPSCPASMAVARVDGNRGFHAPPPHSCSACSCLPGFGATCKATVLESGPGCEGDGTPRALAIGGCVTIAPDSSFKVTVEQTGGACNAIGGIPQATPPTWDARIRACGAPTLLRTGCGAGEVCAPDPPSPFRARHCVSKSGDVACPGGAYSEKLVAETAADSRGCDGCKCGPPSNACRGSGRVSPTSTTCSAAGASTFNVPTEACQTGASVTIFTLSSVTPTCELASPATPTGSVAPAPAHTICCAP